MQPRFGIIAGKGDVPAHVVAACCRTGQKPFVVAFRGATSPDTVEGVPHIWAEITEVGRVLGALREQGVRDLVLIGPLDRPDFASLRPDWTGVKLMPKLLGAARRGDDALMTAIVDFLEQEGFRLHGAEAVAEELAAPCGPLTRRQPDEAARKDIARGVGVLRALGALDVGQAVVVRNQRVLAIEAAEGTDAMLERCRAFRRPRTGGVLVKLPKPGQERRVDLPTIGPPTVEGAAAAGLAGIAVEAGGTLVVDRQTVARTAERLGLFLVGLERDHSV